MQVLVTGAKGGIGSATVQALKAAGIAVLEIDEVDADLTSLSDMQKLSEAYSTIKIDWLVFAHGYIGESEVEKTFQLNTLSPIYLSKLFLPQMPAGGGIVFISSTAAFVGNSQFPVYSASKAAIHIYMKALARGDTDHLFFAIAPGPTNTPMRERVMGDAASAQPPSAVAKVIADIVSGAAKFTSGDIIVVRDSKVSVEPRAA